MRTVPSLVALCLSAILPAAAQTDAKRCNMPATFKQLDPEGARKVLTAPDALVFSATMRVDADGGPHTYSAKDPDGTLCNPKKHPENVKKDPLALGCAMDTVCVGVNIKVPDGRTLDYRKCPELLTAFRLIRDSHWKPPAGYEIQGIGIEMKSKNLPCLDANGAYIVSTSSTPSGVGGGACDQAKYLDTLVPSIVVPQCWSNAFRKKNPKTCASLPEPGIVPDVEAGDLVALNGRSSGKPSFAVIGDLGPNRKLGEASVGLLMQAAGLTKPPTYLAATNSLDGREQFDVVVFKHKQFGKPLTVANAPAMALAAKMAFEQWGGGKFATARERLAACGRIASPVAP